MGRSTATWVEQVASAVYLGLLAKLTAIQKLPPRRIPLERAAVYLLGCTAGPRVGGSTRMYMYCAECAHVL